MRNLRRYAFNTGLGFVGLLLLASCQNMDVTTKGVTSSGRGYSRSNPNEVTAIVAQKGEDKGQKVTISEGYTEYDRWSEVAYHITTGRQTTIFTSRTDQGNPKPDAIEFSANGAQGKANTSLVFAFKKTDESIGEFLRQYKMDDQEFAQTTLRQAVQQEMVRIMRGYDPVQAMEKQDEIAIKLKEALQKRFGKMVEIQEVGFTDQFGFSEAVMGAISAASQAKAEESAVNSRIKLLQAQGALREEEAKAFNRLTPEKRRYDLEKLMIEKGLNPYQPQFVVPAVPSPQAK